MREIPEQGAASGVADNAATSMEALLGFLTVLTVIAAELLRVTYLHRTQLEAAAEIVLSSVQLDVLKASSSKLPQVLTVAWPLRVEAAS